MRARALRASAYGAAEHPPTLTPPPPSTTQRNNSYIEYESKLERLRRHRRKALGLGGKKKKSLADYAIVRRAHFVFERAARRFKGDLRIWAQWLAFCRETREFFSSVLSFVARLCVFFVCLSHSRTSLQPLNLRLGAAAEPRRGARRAAAPGRARPLDRRRRVRV